VATKDSSTRSFRGGRVIQLYFVYRVNELLSQFFLLDGPIPAKIVDAMVGPGAVPLPSLGLGPMSKSKIIECLKRQSSFLDLSKAYS
jgi:hypothetical protein